MPKPIQTKTQIKQSYSPFSELLARGVLSGQIPARNKAAREWFREKGRKEQLTGDTLIRMAKKNRGRDTAVIGRMFMYRYDPKHKATLPYYDAYPLIFPIEHYEDGFLGINMHYLPPPMRAKLMDALFSITNNKKYDYSTKLRISYRILNGAAKFKYFKPCIKRYLDDHVKSQMIEIYAAEWDMVLMMPLASFKKASATKVWIDSQRIIRES